jgi:hypothetical protein
MAPEHFRTFIGIQAAYGRWLQTALALANGIALYRWPDHFPPLLGFSAALISAFCSWVNFTLLANAAFSGQESANEHRAVNLTLMGAVIFGVLSACLFFTTFYP